MKTKELRPIHTQPKVWEAIERTVLEHLRREIYSPILEELAEDEEQILRNASPDPLIDAIERDVVRYEGGAFSGKFSARVVKRLRDLGATWAKSDGTYRIAAGKLPVDVRQTIALSSERFREMAEKIDARLSKILPEQVAESIKLDRVYEQTIYRVGRDIDDSLKVVQVQPKFTEEQAKKIRDEYTENMRLSIRDWSAKEIRDLRKAMRDQVLKGVRYEEMIDTIRKSYGVSANKAKFLARQETNLLTVKIKETRYLDAGVPDYKWRCVSGSPAHPVRPMHKALDGRIFSWNDPPIVDEQGNRKHPGEDFNCRCTAIPLVRF